MKIVKDGLYMYNDGKIFFIVKANGVDHIREYADCFSASVVFDLSGYYPVGEFSEDWQINKFKRLDNKITHHHIGEE